MQTKSWPNCFLVREKSRLSQTNAPDSSNLTIKLSKVKVTQKRYLLIQGGSQNLEDEENMQKVKMHVASVLI